MLFGQNEVVKAAATKPKVRFNRFNKMTLGSKISFIVILLLVVAAVFAPVITPYSPMAITESYQAPTGAHLFGTDNLGRDVLTRVIFGARYSLVIGLSSIAFALVLGSIIGAIAAVSRAWVSEIIMRLIDIVMSIPGIALAAVFVAVLGQSMIGIIISIGVLYVPQIARIVRANIISEYGKDYVRAVIVSGARAPWILIKHVMRNIAAPVMVFTTLSVADAIVFEASLSFINAGIPEPTPTWGQHPVVREGRRHLRVLVAGAVPRSCDHDHRTVPEHPVRRHNRRDGGGPDRPGREDRGRRGCRPQGRPSAHRPGRGLRRAA